MNVLPLLAQESTRSELRWHAMPEPWLVVMVIVPAVLLLAWWGYRSERDVPFRMRVLLASLRVGALVLFLGLLFGPYAELSEMRVVRSHLVVLVDTSDSMSTQDNYEDDDAEVLADAAGIPVSSVRDSTRLDLARAVLSNRETELLERYAEDFRVHVMSFGSQLRPLVSTGDTTEGDGGDGPTDAERLRRGITDMRATEPSTRLGQAVATVLDTFRLRDEPVAGIVVLSDGQDNAGKPNPLQAGRRAGTSNVPVYSVAVGDPRSPQNVHVSNLRAKEVVLARDIAVFEMTVRAKGYENVPAQIEMRRLDENGEPQGSPMSIRPDSVILKGGDEEQAVKITHVFTRAGTYALRIGVPPQPEERIEADNWVTHTIRVIDRKIKVLYVEGPPRHEFTFLSRALTRDSETMLAHTLLMDADPDTPQRATRSPGWHALDMSNGLPVREKLFDYDVIILGDLDWRELGPTMDRAKQATADLHEFVEKGGGLIMLAGPQHNPSRYRDTEIAALLPVVIDRTTENTDPLIDPAQGFSLRVTAEGELSPIMDVARDIEKSKRLWETNKWWRQYFAYPALRAKSLAKVLAVSTEPRHINKYGPRPAIATMLYARGRVLFVGVDDLWRTRREKGDDYFYRFYGEAVRVLATYKLLGGNRRFKIITDRDAYALDDPVRITLDVLDTDYQPSREESHTVQLEMPGDEPGTRETVELEIEAAGKKEEGVFRRTIVPTRAGQYRLSYDTGERGDEPAEKLFHVRQSSLEGRDLLLDEATLTQMADSSGGGRLMHLWDLPEFEPPARSKPVPTDVRPEELWDSYWSLLLALALLAAEWLLRKRHQLV